MVTGAGVRALAWILGEPGASRTVLDAQVPYAKAALTEYVGAEPKQNVAADEAARMADVAYWRALKLLATDYPERIGQIPALGVACTATIATDRVKRGEHRAHVAVRRPGRVRVQSLVLEKGARDRNGEEEIVSCMILNALAAACRVEEGLDLGLRGGERVQTQDTPLDAAFVELIEGNRSLLVVSPEGAVRGDPPSPCAVLAGSFNPLHQGHIDLLAVASRLVRRPGLFELSVTNVEKPPLTLPVLQARLAQFRGIASVVLTRAPTFVEKSARLPNTTFVIGYDTALRLFDEHFYPPYDPSQDSARLGSAWAIALSQIRERGGSFLVAGRAVDGAYRGLRDITEAKRMGDMLREIPESAFREDVSSTAIREAHGQAG